MPADVRLRPLFQAAEDLPAMARWLWREWGAARGYALGETEAWLAGFAVPNGRETGFAAYGDDGPLGIALLREHDLAEQPELSPWLSSLFVVSAYRGRGIGARLTRAIEGTAVDRGVRRLYLYTRDRERFYR